VRPGGAGPGDPIPSPAAPGAPPAAPEEQPVTLRPDLGSARAFVRNSAVMSVGTALSRLTGFLRLAAMAYALGVTESRLADAYNVANTTPNIIYELALGGILSSVFVPVFVEWLETRGRDEAWRTAQVVLTFTLVVLSAVMLVGILASGPIVRLYTSRVPPGPDRDAARAFASFALKWFMPQIVFYGIGAVATGLLNAHRRFAVPMFAPILNNLLVTATFFVFALLPGPRVPTPSNITELQRYLLAIGTTLGVVGMSVVLFPWLRRLGFRWRWRLDLHDPGFRRIGRLAGWVFLYVMVNQVGYLVVIVLAAKVQGGYTAYTSAFIFFQLPHAIFAVSIMTALLPSLSSRWAAGDREGFRALLSQGIRGTAFIVIPASFGYLALATPIVRLLLQHGVTGEGSTDLVARVLIYFSIGLFSFSSFQLLLRAFYAMQDTKTPGKINVAAVGLNVVVDVVLFRYLRVEGLALGHAIAYTFAATFSAVVIGRRLGGIEGRLLLRSLGQILVAGVATGVAAYIASRVVAGALGTTELGPRMLQVGAGVAAGLAGFVLVAMAFRMQELDSIRQLVGVRGTRPRGASRGGPR
jgi:putative peptidoglycan lipid II flippase